METAENIPKMDYIGLPKDQDMAINVGGWLCPELTRTVRVGRV
jgi:hypothetical protein